MVRELIAAYRAWPFDALDFVDGFGWIGVEDAALDKCINGGHTLL